MSVSKAFEDVRDLVTYGCTPEQAVEVLKLVELRRIAGNLEDISLALRDMQEPLEALEGCVSKTSRGSFFCITGNVTNYEG